MEGPSGPWCPVQDDTFVTDTTPKDAEGTVMNEEISRALEGSSQTRRDMGRVAGLLLATMLVSCGGGGGDSTSSSGGYRKIILKKGAGATRINKPIYRMKPDSPKEEALPSFILA